jgi:NADH-quinone oxidoreductase subunit F
MPSVDLTFADETIAQCGRTPDAVIPILQTLQEHYGYLPEEILRRICECTEITPASIAGVASFFDMFRFQPVGKYIVRVCRGTACHVAGAERVEDALRQQLRIPAGDDTDPDRQFTIEPVACLGCCTLAPVARISHETFGHVQAERVPALLRAFLDSQTDDPATVKSTEHHRRRKNGTVQIHVGLGSCCMAKGSDRLFHALLDNAEAAGVEVTVKRVGCVGMCHRTPMIEVATAGKPSAFYADLTPAQARELVLRHTRPRGFLGRINRLATRALDNLLLDTADKPDVQRYSISLRDPGVKAFLGKQVHIATEHFGKIDPLDLDEYVAHEGFAALARCLGMPVRSGAAGRDQATFPLTPALSPGERENRSQGRNKIGAVATAKTPEAPFPLLKGEGQGEGERDARIPATSPCNLLPLPPDQIITAIERSGLRGRGGAGFPTGPKWRVVAQQTSDTKYVICNGDEGDPGAFMDRMLLESFPFRIIEGMAIAALAVGAHEGIFYIRHEYPLAVRRVRAAIEMLEKRGWIGERLLGSDYAFRLRIKEGAGAFVCGEETALIASIEGRRGMPRLRPPFPAESGLWDKPTLINNVETLALVPWIIRHGADQFAKLGTRTSTGTKVFALAGKIRRGGLIEVPMGTTIREIVEEIGGGASDGNRFKAVQIGGPSGGCVPARLADTPVDYDSLRTVGAIMGSGGLVVLDDADCMVDIARYFLQFTQDQSCGKCTFCRIGTKRMLDILDRLCAGKGQRGDLEELERLGQHVGDGSLCGLGKTAPNPVLTTLRYFRDEYEAHLQGRCPAGRCRALIKYRITDDCTGCTICAQRCPVNAIPMTPYQRHVINDDLCTRCDTCKQVCPHGAVEVR